MQDLGASGFRTVWVADSQLLVGEAESLDDCGIHFAFPERSRRLVENLQNGEEKGAVGGNWDRRHDAHTTGEAATALGVVVAKCRELVDLSVATGSSAPDPSSEHCHSHSVTRTGAQRVKVAPSCATRSQSAR